MLAVALFDQWVEYQVAGGLYSLGAWDTNVPQVDAFIIALPLIAAALILPVNILTFRNRKRQITMSKYAIALCLATVLVFAWVHYEAIDALKNLYGELEIVYHTTVFFPLVAVVLIAMAMRHIRKDEELVRSADRIR